MQITQTVFSVDGLDFESRGVPDYYLHGATGIVVKREAWDKALKRGWVAERLGAKGRPELLQNRAKATRKFSSPEAAAKAAISEWCERKFQAPA